MAMKVFEEVTLSRNRPNVLFRHAAGGRPGTEMEALASIDSHMLGFGLGSGVPEHLSGDAKALAAGRASLGPALPRANLGYALWLASFQAGLKNMWS
ncbi:hypothetical protein V495_07061 [Pseudogymnoascus sp. VKM F-4514 (FW-929)]|nr:hypothetical protein V490_06036 [Pseudogymnoascus sp. VKM F-3557]KFY37611.1 hypothetical protein V495_07061 [Pseudogymnoascus sp. VKM F-4514 (FW-929)]KFY58385.1 hypothetical protein V497_04853 [Pseudogymnoascus sp. VKM F-4516 (FW-969)]